MTDQEINIAIAEWCGWTKIFIDEATFPGHPILCGMVWTKKGFEKSGICQAVPDYCRDLNAMHEAEKKLQQDEQEVYWAQLVGVVWNPVLAEYPDSKQTDLNIKLTLLFSTARQRSEALLRTIGKWVRIGPKK